jgi:hypothetical protein
MRSVRFDGALRWYGLEFTFNWSELEFSMGGGGTAIFIYLIVYGWRFNSVPAIILTNSIALVRMYGWFMLMGEDVFVSRLPCDFTPSHNFPI